MKNLLLIALCAISFGAWAQVQINKPLQLSGSGTDARIEGIEDVSANDHAANKIYVDTAIANRAGGSTSNMLYVLSANPSSVSIPTNNSNSASPVKIYAVYVSGTPSNLTYSVTGTPSGVFASLSPGGGTPNSVSSLVFEVADTATPGTYPIVITATGGMTVQTANVSLTVQAPKTVFVSNTSYTGATMGGISGADSKCQTLAGNAGLSGTYKAWLSISGNSPSTRFTQSTTPYALVNNTIIATDWADLTDGTLLSSINYDQNGNNVGNVRVWTHTTTNGNWNSGNCTNTCTNWTNTTGDAQWGESGKTNSQWTAQGVSSGLTSCGGTHECTSCGCSLRLYCFQQ